MFRPLSRFLIAASLVCVGSACQKGAGELVLDDALAITAVHIEGRAGVLHIRGVPGTADEEGGIHGTHRVTGLGATGPSRVSIDEAGVMTVFADCVPLLPCTIELDLELPERIPVTVGLASGSVDVDGVVEADIRVDRGDVDIAGAYSAMVRVGSGALRTRLLPEANLRAVVVRGNVDVEVPQGGWQIKAVASELKLSGVSLDHQAKGVLDVHAPSGSVLLAGVKDLAARH